jgi:hypothetical protein
MCGVKQQIGMGGSAVPGSAESNLFDIESGFSRIICRIVA